MTSEKQQTLEVVLNLASTYLQRAISELEKNGAKAQGAASQAQYLYLQAKKGAGRLPGLEDVVDNANRGLAISHLVQAQAQYVAHLAMPFDIYPQILEDVAEKFGKAYHWFKKFENSFKTPREQDEKKQLLSQLFECWANVRLGVAEYTLSVGSKVIRESLSTFDHKGLSEGINIWNAALSKYESLIQVQNQAEAEGIHLYPGFAATAKRRIVGIKIAAAAMAHSIGLPEQAGMYSPSKN